MHHTGGHRAYERDTYENAGEKAKRDEEVHRSHDSTCMQHAHNSLQRTHDRRCRFLSAWVANPF